MSSRDATAPPPSSARKRKSRGKGLRVRSGCIRCKTRHVKCSEERPACSACVKTGHVCEYPGQASTSTDGDSRQDAPRTAASGQEGHSDGQFDLGAEFTSEAPNSADQNDGLTTAQRYTDSQAEPSAGGAFCDEAVYDAGAFETSPGSAWSGWANVSAEAAPLKWFGLVATDAAHDQSHRLQESLQNLGTPGLPGNALNIGLPDADDLTSQDPPGSLLSQSVKYCSQDEMTLSAQEAGLLQHFVLNISAWIDVTDCDRSFAVIVPQMAMRNRGLMNAILALSARHLSILAISLPGSEEPHSAKTSALQYYYQTLNYLQQEMRSTAFLTSDELLTTVLLVSTYEMIDGSGRGWERHLKGVFWIQRSQLIHGESEGLKQRIWWAWLRQDIWVAYREQRKILSYYSLTRECSDLGFWELVDRAVWLLGQCVNYASLKEQHAGQTDIQGRIDRSCSLWASLETWSTCFAKFDRRLPMASNERMAFKPIWINPPAAALAMQVHKFSKILLLEHTPATGGLKELMGRQANLQASIEVICGIACSIFDDGASIISTMCLYAAGLHVRHQAERDHVVELVQAHRSRTGWPHYDLSDDLRRHWADGISGD